MKHFIAQAINITFYVLFQSVDKAHKKQKYKQQRVRDREKEREKKKQEKFRVYPYICDGEKLKW